MVTKLRNMTADDKLSRLVKTGSRYLYFFLSYDFLKFHRMQIHANFRNTCRPETETENYAKHAKQ
jgi:hypothetical protein